MSDPLDATSAALSGMRAWLVGGAVRDRLLGRPAPLDLDVAVDGDPRRPARALARASRGVAFPLSETFGGWRVVGPRHAWQVDLIPLRDGSLASDLGARDFTINALAEPLSDAAAAAGAAPGPTAASPGPTTAFPGPTTASPRPTTASPGAVVDLFGGLEDLQARRLRMVAPHAFEDDPLRVWRLARHAVELGFDIDPPTANAARAAAPRLDRVAPERVFGELKRILAVPLPQLGVALLRDLGGFTAKWPELDALAGVEQSRFHALDVWEHTLVVLTHVAEYPERGPLGEHRDAVAALLAEPLADELTRGTALRLGALLHDVAKPATRALTDDGHVTFFGHAELGADTARAMLRRQRASEKLVEHGVALVRWHLRVGRVFYERRRGEDPRRTTFRYLADCGPVAADVALLAMADRRGNDSDEDLAAYHALCRELLGAALAQRAVGRRVPLVRGDEVARAVGRSPGPWLADVLRRIEEDHFAGAIATREDALERAREYARSESA